MSTRTERIRALNDELRRDIQKGVAVITPGVAALGVETVATIFKTVAVFDDFCSANDSHSEHDFGALDVKGKTVFFKIDYYDRSLRIHSPDATDPTVTRRVITLMLAEEY